LAEKKPGISRFFYAWRSIGCGLDSRETLNFRQKNGRFMRPEKSIDA